MKIKKHMDFFGNIIMKVTKIKQIIQEKFKHLTVKHNNLLMNGTIHHKRQ